MTRLGLATLGAVLVLGALAVVVARAFGASGSRAAALVTVASHWLTAWVLWTFAPSMLVRLVAGLPKGFAMSREDARFVAEFIDSLFPVSPEGVDFDAFICNAAVNDYNLEAITVPTLIIHTKDDHVASHEASRRAAERIPGARFVSLESGGHLMLGQMKTVHDELARFFGERRDRRAAPVAS